MILPLLHAAQSAAELTMVDGSVLALAFAGMVTSIVAIWRPANWRRVNPCTSRRARRRAFGILASIVVFLAVVPLAAPIDHIFFPPAVSAVQEEVHTAHCHNSPGSCSDLPLVSGPGQFLATEPLLVVPALLTLLLVFSTPLITGITHTPEVPPPMRRAVAV